jgi:tRNA pseudouridine32 synthase/23S rRNA pseudouridine746 synthase
VVEGAPTGEEGEIDLPLGRLDAMRGWWMRPDPLGLPARTSWRVLVKSDNALTFIEHAHGRTHQIACMRMRWGAHSRRSDLAQSPRGPSPLHLHARVVSAVQDGKPPVIAVAAPAHMCEALTACGWNDEAHRNTVL